MQQLILSSWYTGESVFFLDDAVINSRRKKSILVGVEVSPEVQTSIITAKRLLQIHMPAYNSIP